MLVRLLALAGLIGAFLHSPVAQSEEPDFFETKIRPVLAQNCYKCHGAKQQKGGIRLDEPKHLANAGDGSVTSNAHSATNKTRELSRDCALIVGRRQRTPAAH